MTMGSVWVVGGLVLEGATWEGKCLQRNVLIHKFHCCFRVRLQVFGGWVLGLNQRRDITQTFSYDFHVFIREVEKKHVGVDFIRLLKTRVRG